MRQLFQSAKVVLNNRIYELLKIVGLSDKKQSIGLGIFKSNDMLLICCYDASTNQFGKLDEDKLAFASTVLNYLKDPLGPHLHNSLFAMNLVSDLMETDKSVVDVLVGDISFDAGSPFELISIDGGQAPYLYAAVDASSKEEIGKILISNTELELYSGYSLRD